MRNLKCIIIYYRFTWVLKIEEGGKWINTLFQSSESAHYFYWHYKDLGYDTEIYDVTQQPHIEEHLAKIKSSRTL